MQRQLVVFASVCLSLQLLCRPIAASTIIPFGSAANQFELVFEEINNPHNPADTTGDPNPAGSVGYVYQIQKFEVSRDQVLKANAAGGLGIDLEDLSQYTPPLTGGNRPDRPATGVSWFEAAKFVNWLNTSKGYHEAYKFDASGNFALWQSTDLGYNPTNRFRNSQAIFVLPTIDEWYKAAYYKASNNTYLNYPTGSDSPPNSVGGGTASGTAVYGRAVVDGPADIEDAGGLNSYLLMAMGGNVFEWQETEADLVNDSVSSHRAVRGGSWIYDVSYLNANKRIVDFPTNESVNVGFRVVMLVPEPASHFLLGIGTFVTILFRRSRSVGRWTR